MLLLSAVRARARLVGWVRRMIGTSRPAHWGSIGTWKIEVVSTWKGKILLYMEKYVSLHYVEFPILSLRGKNQIPSQCGKCFLLVSSRLLV